ncbi:MAG: peptide deformylase [Candidatus Paceibacterota bacterium]|jgi:peptide deformylase
MDYTKRVKELNNVFGKLLDECPELVFIGDPILRQKTSDVSLEEGLATGDKLKVTLKKYRMVAGFGRGLAAPQTGESKSVFVTFIDDKFKTYINPKIVEKSFEQNFYRESCLSCGFLSVDVKRSVSITLEYTDEQGDKRKERLDDFLARLIQHECDHLFGLVNIDRAEPGSIEFMLNDPLKEKIRDIK